MSESKFNIYDAYMYKYKKFILALSYTPGLDIQPIIDDMAKTFNFITLKLEGPTMLKQDSIFNYEKLNEQIKKILDENQKIVELNIPGSLGKGILLYGLNFPSSKITTPIDLQLHYSASVSMFLKANTDEFGLPQYTVDDYNKFKDILSENKINKYFNIKSVVGFEINDSTFEKIIDFLEWKVYGKDYATLSTKAKKENQNKPLINKDAIDILEVSKKNEVIRDEIDTDTTDASLSITADEADYNGKYHTPIKETARYINKKIEESFTESDLSKEWDSNMDDDSPDEEILIINQNGGSINSFGKKFSQLSDEELNQLIKLI